MSRDWDAAAYRAWFDTPLGAQVWKDERRALEQLLGDVDDRTVLDAGCGDGRLAVELARAGARVTGVDVSSDLSIPDQAFDLVVAVTVLCVVHQPQQVVAELVRVLKPGGQMVIGELGRWSGWAAR